MGLMALDKGVFQYQRLKLRPYHNGVEVVHRGHHGPGLLVVSPPGLEILAHPVFQLFGLAHVDDLARLVHHDVYARLQGQAVRLFQKLCFRHFSHLAYASVYHAQGPAGKVAFLPPAD